MKKSVILLAACFFSGLTIHTSAQTLSLVHVLPDARMLAMGNTGVAQPASSFSLYANTAATALSTERLSFAASYAMWQPGVQNNRLMGGSGYVRLGERFTIAAGARFFTYPQVTFYDNNGYAKGTYKPMEYTADIGFAFRIIPGFAVSANVHYLSSDMGTEQKGSAFLADIGLMYTVAGLRAGLTATHLGSKIDYGYGAYELPASVNAGLGYRFEFGNKHSISPIMEVSYRLPRNRSGIVAGAGMEYAFMQLVFLRAGYRLGNQSISEPSYFSAGCGVSFAGVALDFVYLLADQNSPLKNTMQLSLGWTLR